MRRPYELQHKEQVFSSEEDLMRFIKGLLLDDFKVYELNQGQGELVPYHSHAHTELLLVLEGRMRVIVEEDILEVHEGAFLTIHPWAIHLLCFPYEEGARYYLCSPKKGKKS